MKKFNKVLYGQEYWLNDALYMTELERKYDEGKASGFNEGKTSGYKAGIDKGSSNKQYEIAIKMLENDKTIEEVNKYIYGIYNNISSLEHVFSNLSYDTGVECSLAYNFVHVLKN